MKISEAWLRSYVNPAISTQQLVAQLTMAGLEVDSVEPAAAEFSGVVVGRVVSLEQHPDADRLRVCQVDVGQDSPLQIVCGASNVRVGLRIPAALIGAILPEDFKIKKSKLRGVESFGMLCSAKELGLASDAQGLLELPDDAPVGADIREYLSLNDQLIEVDLTPNRADCLSVEGIAREVAVLNDQHFTTVEFTQTAIASTQKRDVDVQVPQACPRYLGRLIEGINPNALTPLWLQERLRRSGLRSLGAVIDITNYVLLELGQPLHAFDADKLTGNIVVRYAKENESLSLLNGQSIALQSNTLVIADQQQALALAGIMGGEFSAVSDHSINIFLECAFFTPTAIAGKARQYGLHTDSSHRFERGVDFTLQHKAIERATQLIVDIAGGRVGAITDVTTSSALPSRNPVLLRRQRLLSVLGMEFEDVWLSRCLQRLGMEICNHPEGYWVTPPGNRFDIAIEADLIEEIARIYGYNQLPSQSILMRATLGSATEQTIDLDRLKDVLVDRGYQEAITYSFVDENLQQLIAPHESFERLQNPISAELAVMRTSLWCGLLTAALHNVNRQQTRLRLFETGLRFSKQDTQTLQQKMVAGLALGNVYPEQWSSQAKSVDFFDIKADVCALFALTDLNVTFSADTHPALHPGQTARLTSEHGEHLGWLGMLHPTLEKRLGFDQQVFLFELSQEVLLQKKKAQFKPLSKYPSVRRDLALIVKDEVTSSAIIDSINSCQQPTLQQVAIFDIYRGKGIAIGEKSVALSLCLQDDTQTLTDAHIDAIVSTFLETLARHTGAKLRD